MKTTMYSPVARKYRMPFEPPPKQWNGWRWEPYTSSLGGAGSIALYARHGHRERFRVGFSFAGLRSAIEIHRAMTYLIRHEFSDRVVLGFWRAITDLLGEYPYVQRVDVARLAVARTGVAGVWPPSRWRIANGARRPRRPHARKKKEAA